jgi:hypothetical protein
MDVAAAAAAEVWAAALVFAWLLLTSFSASLSGLLCTLTRREERQR